MPGNEKALKKPIIPRVGQEWEIWSSYVMFRIPTIFQLSVLGLILSSQITFQITFQTGKRKATLSSGQFCVSWLPILIERAYTPPAVLPHNHTSLLFLVTVIEDPSKANDFVAIMEATGFHHSFSFLSWSTHFPGNVYQKCQNESRFSQDTSCN